MQRLAGRVAVVTGSISSVLFSAQSRGLLFQPISVKGLQSYRFSSSLAFFAKVQSVISATEILSWVFRVA